MIPSGWKRVGRYAIEHRFGQLRIARVDSPHTRYVVWQKGADWFRPDIPPCKKLDQAISEAEKLLLHN